MKDLWSVTYHGLFGVLRMIRFPREAMQPSPQLRSNTMHCLWNSSNGCRSHWFTKHAALAYWKLSELNKFILLKDCLLGAPTLQYGESKFRCILATRRGRNRHYHKRWQWAFVACLLKGTVFHSTSVPQSLASSYLGGAVICHPSTETHEEDLPWKWFSDVVKLAQK